MKPNRDKFEAWAKEYHIDLDKYSSAGVRADQYFFDVTRGAWELWQRVQNLETTNNLLQHELDHRV